MMQKSLLIQQKQTPLYDFTFEYAVDGKLYSRSMIGRAITIQVKTDNPASLVMDPNINLLATFEVQDLRTAR